MIPTDRSRSTIRRGTSSTRELGDTCADGPSERLRPLPLRRREPLSERRSFGHGRPVCRPGFADDVAERELRRHGECSPEPVAREENGRTTRSTTRASRVPARVGSTTSMRPCWTTPARLAPPAVDWDAWYLNEPRPLYGSRIQRHAAKTRQRQGAATAPNPAKRNNSLTTAQDLTPASSYTCKGSAGELSWNASTKVLTVNGTMPINGSVKVKTICEHVHRLGTMYVSGAFLIKNSKLCQATTGSGSSITCTTAGWDPAARMPSASSPTGMARAGRRRTGSQAGQRPTRDRVWPGRYVPDERDRNRYDFPVRRASRRVDGKPRPERESSFPGLQLRTGRDAGQP